jgi:hypothetical protein
LGLNYISHQRTILADTKGQANNYNKKKPAMQGTADFFFKRGD